MGNRIHRLDFHLSDGGVGRPGCGHHLLEAPQRDIAIDRKRGGQPERTDATGGMASYGADLLRIEHSPFAAENILDLPVVEARRAAGHNQHRLLADAEADCLGDLRGFDTVRLGRELDGRRAVVGFDDLDVRCFCLKEGADCFQAHPGILPRGQPRRRVQSIAAAGAQTAMC